MSQGRGLRIAVLVSVLLCTFVVWTPPTALADGTPPVWGDPPPPPPPGGGGAPEAYGDLDVVPELLGELSLVLTVLDAI